MLSIQDKVATINRIGAATGKKLSKLGIETINDLLFYFPYRYEDYSEQIAIADLQPGSSANIVGQVELIQSRRARFKKMSIIEALVSDELESLKVVWFNQPFIAKTIKVGDTVSLSGKIEEEYGGFLMKSPAYEKISRNKPIHTQGLVPHYRLTAGLTHKQIRFLIKQVIGLANNLPDWLPPKVVKNLKLLPLGQAVKKIHFPQNWEDMETARQRLAFNELFLIQLQSQILRQKIATCRANIIIFEEKETKKFVSELPFRLTNDQKKCSWQILQDLGKDQPMTRLLEGDVGSGKTVVAAIAMLNVALNKKQAVLMAPTEILAAQHYNSLQTLLINSDLKIGLITSGLKKSNWDKNKSSSGKKEILSQADIVIGTHALIQEDAIFNNLGLTIIDEQHRFGVEQRKKLIQANTGLFSPHLLSMSATPIPRSLALAIYGDLDISVIKEMPTGRKKIITQVVAENARSRAYDFIRSEVKAGRQVFVICPLIDVSDKLGVKSVKEEYEKLDKLIFPEISIDFLHGRMPTKEKEEVMGKFLSGETKILVSTSVVEVGVDVPNATVMMVEGADRFGLAQLHQFRGRVGRSDWQSYCFLFTESTSPVAKQRLAALEKYHDGFSLAKVDLKFRGPGEVFGTAQKGFPDLQLASLFDYELMNKAKKEAEKLISDSPDLSSWPDLKEKIAASAHLE